MFTSVRRIVGVALLLVLAPPLFADTEYVNETYGLRLTVPDGWLCAEQPRPGTALNVVLGPQGREDIQLSLRLVTPGTSRDPEAVQRLALATAKAGQGYSNIRGITRSVAGEDVPGLMVDSQASGVPLRVRQAYVRGHDDVLILQDVAIVEVFDAQVDVFDDIWDTLELLPLSEQRQQRNALQAIADRCGSEADWAADWDEAASRARAERRAVLVTARIYPGFAISDDLMAGPFMDEDILALVNSRFVPLRFERGMEAPFTDPEVFGLGPHTFGTAALVVHPDGHVLADGRVVTHAFLREALEVDPSLTGPGADRRQLPEARARQLLGRGELDAVERLLDSPQAPVEDVLLAHLDFIRRDGDRAREHLRLARQAAHAEQPASDLDRRVRDELLVMVDLDEALVLIRQGRLDQALPLLEGVLARHPDDPQTREAEYRLGAIERLRDGPDVAEQRWRRLIEQHPESRWAWAAAAILTSTSWSVGLGGRLDWPPEEEWSVLASPSTLR